MTLASSALVIFVLRFFSVNDALEIIFSCFAHLYTERASSGLLCGSGAEPKSPIWPSRLLLSPHAYHTSPIISTHVFIEPVFVVPVSTGPVVASHEPRIVNPIVVSPAKQILHTILIVIPTMIRLIFCIIPMKPYMCKIIQTSFLNHHLSSCDTFEVVQR